MSPTGARDFFLYYILVGTMIVIIIFPYTHPPRTNEAGTVKATLVSTVLYESSYVVRVQQQTLFLHRHNRTNVSESTDFYSTLNTT